MKQMRLDSWVRGAMAASLLATLPVIAAPAGAQGFGLNEIGTCAVGRAGAGVGAPCLDASRIYWNPASPVRTEGVHLLGGAAAVQLDGGFTQDTTGLHYPSDVPLEIPPHLFATYQVLPRWNVGLGVYVPYGLTSQWEQDFPGRFSAQRASLASIYVQPNLAWDLIPGRLAIGGGPVIGISTVELAQSLDLATTPARTLPNGTVISFGQLGIPARTEFARATLEGSAVAWGYNVGVHAQLTRTVSIGARYLSELQFDYRDATADFTQVNTGLTLAANNPLGVPGGTSLDAVLGPQFQGAGALTERPVATRINHPAQAQVGIGFTGLPNTTINVDYAWVGYSAFDELPVDFGGAAPTPPDRLLIEDYEDSWALRGSLDYAFGNGWTAQGGVHYVNTPVPDVTVTPLLPDMDRWNFAGGLGIPFGSRWALDLAYLRVETPGRRGRLDERTSRSQTAEALNEGWYELSANIYSVSLRARF